MIAKVTGKFDRVYKNSLIVDVAGIGFKIAVPARILNRKAAQGETVSLYTYTYVREDTLSLYGFDTLEELSLFETLLAIAGVGPKTALSVISSGGRDEIAQAILNGDVDFFTTIPGVGRKTAQRIIIDLKATLGADNGTDLFEVVSPAYEETVQALRQFGFTQSEARESLRTIKGKGKMTTEQLIKEALKTIGK